MWQTITNAFKIKEVRRKILITIALLFVYRLGCFIPVPGVNIFSGLKDVPYFQIMSGISGGALTYGTFFAMGIGPYINASIIIQLLSAGIPALERLSKQGEEGRKRLNAYTRILTLVLAIVQSIGILVAFGGDGAVDTTKIFNTLGNSDFLHFLSYAFIVIVYTAGACLTMWIGERITDYGVSNGISLLIFAGIIATAANAIIGLFRGWNESSIWMIVSFVVAAIVIFAAIVTVDTAERKIPVQYAKQVKGRKMYGGQSTHIPIKVNASGVMPLIFAFAILSFPDMIMSFFNITDNWWIRNVGTGSWAYMVILCVLILFFSYFYNQMQFNPDDISKSIQGNGGFIPGTRPGKPTADYLRKISNRITLFGAIFLAIVALIPTMVFKSINMGLVNVFSATGLLIIVSVALEFEQALQSQIMMKNYKGFLK
jgi:preprotein translocase subunit SecY